MIAQSESDLRQQVEEDIHLLCQPLTVLHCWLESCRQQSDCQAMRQAIEAGLVEADRLFAAVRQMRRHLYQEETVTRSTTS